MYIKTTKYNLIVRLILKLKQMREKICHENETNTNQNEEIILIKYHKRVERINNKNTTLNHFTMLIRTSL